MRIAKGVETSKKKVNALSRVEKLASLVVVVVFFCSTNLGANYLKLFP